MKILIVEDDVVSRMVLKNILVKEGAYDVIEAPNGAVAWELLQTPPVPDVCLTDVLMPHLDGVQLLQKIRTDSRLSRMPVVFCTCITDRTIVATAAKLEVRHYLLKPYSPLKVLAAVRDALTKPSQSSSEKWPALARRLNLSPAELAQLVQTLASQAKATVPTLRESLHLGDRREALCQINSLKSAGLNIEDDEFTELVTNLETRIDKGEHIWPADWERIEKQAERLRRLAERLPAILGNPRK